MGDINFGIGYSDAKEIAKDAAMEVFEKNFELLAQDAHELARIRAEELTNVFLEAVQEKSLPVLAAMRDPGVQSSLLTAQSGYAKTGDPDLGDVLVELLVDRIHLNDRRNTAQLALKKSLEVAENLSKELFALLSFNMMVKEVSFGELSSVEEVADSLARAIHPFASDLTAVHPSDLDYLAGLGCLIHAAGTLPPGQSMGMNYPGLFSRGFTEKELMHADHLISSPLVRLINSNEGRYQIDAGTKMGLQALIDTHEAQDLADAALHALTTTRLQDHEIEEMLISSSPELEEPIRRGKELGLAGYLNTAIGTAIGHANARRTIPGFSLDFSNMLS
ncbi:LPO_1073/Vpar_1526 family protein [Streptomyces violaceusniger]|nr:LPO_1073/Vpar_1526 family protein [Streptomyces violaceusniger]